MYYVYFLISPLDNKVFYIGKGKGNRMRKHVHLAKKGKISNGNDYLFRKIKYILESYDDVIYKVVYKTNNEVESYEKEIELIENYGIENLCNLSLGYNIITEEIKNKISNSIKRLYENHEYREKLREIYNSEDYKLSQSISVKNSKLHKEKMASSEVRDLISNNLKKHYINVYGEFKNNEINCHVCKQKIIVYEREFLLSEKYYCSDICKYSIRKSKEYIESMSESVKSSEKHKSIFTEEFRKSISESTKKWWNSLTEEELQDYKQKMSDSLKNSEAHKLKVQSDDYKNNVSNSIKNSESFKKYNERRKGSTRGKYKESQKNLQRRSQSVLVDSNGEIVKEFSGLQEICDYFGIKIATACVWLKKEKTIGDLKIKKKK